MRKVKRIVLVCAVMLLMLSCNTVMAAPGKATVKKAYAAYVKRNLSSSSKYPYGDYAVYDINKDGIPEMFFEYMAGTRSGFKIYTYKNGKVSGMKSFIGVSRIYYNGKKKQICVLTSGGAADNQYTCYKMKGKKLVALSKYESVMEHYGNIRYCKNGKSISKGQFTSYANGIGRWKYIMKWK